MSELQKCAVTLCKTCKYSCGTSGAGMQGVKGIAVTCDYLLKTGNSRLFVKNGYGKKRHEADVCDLYEKAKRKKKSGDEWRAEGFILEGNK